MLSLLLAFVLLACEPAPPATTDAAPAPTDEPKAKAKAGKAKAPPAPVEKVGVKVYFVDSAKMAKGEKPFLVAVERQVGAKTPPKNAIWSLMQGPTEEETAAGLTLVKSGADGFEEFKIEDGVASLKLRGGCTSEGSAVTVYDLMRATLLEFPEIKQVKLLDPEGATQTPEGAVDSKPACLEP